MEEQDILKLPWESLPNEAWSGLRIIKDIVGPGTTLYFEDLRNFIRRLLQNLSSTLDISSDKLEELFWEKNSEWLTIKETNSFYYSTSSQPFNYPLSCLLFPKPYEKIQIAECKKLFNLLSPVGQAIFLRDINNQRQQ